MSSAETHAALRAEADDLLSSGLRDVLADHGEVHVVGSYMMRLMTWRDLDIHEGFWRYLETRAGSSPAS